MARCSAGFRSTSAPTTARGPTLYAPAGQGLVLREVGIFNTTTTACAIAICRATTGGNRGAAITATSDDTPGFTVLGVPVNVHVADATLAGTARQASIGAAIGAGVIFTFGDNGLQIGAGTANGAGIFAVTGTTGQIIDGYFCWDS